MEKAELEAWVAASRAEDVVPEGQLAELARKAAELRGLVDAIDAELKLRSAQLQEACDLILKNMELSGVDSLRAHGFLFFKERRNSVQTPKSLEAKRELFRFLESKGMFDEMVSVNSQTLNALYKSLAAEALKSGVLEFQLPGVGKPSEYVNLKIRRG